MADCERKIKDLEQQLEKYKILSDINTLTLDSLHIEEAETKHAGKIKTDSVTVETQTCCQENASTEVQTDLSSPCDKCTETEDLPAEKVEKV